MNRDEKKIDNTQLDGTDFRQPYRLVTKLLALFGGTAIILSFILLYMVIGLKEPRYYATTTSGDLVPLQTLSEPVISDNYLIQWSALAVRASLNLDFVNLEDNLNNNKKYFTDNGWDIFLAALKKSKILKTISDNKLIISAVVTGTPLILNKSIIAGRYSWMVQMPILLTYTSASNTAKRSFIATIMVQRVPVIGEAQGIQITGFALQTQATAIKGKRSEI